MCIQCTGKKPPKEGKSVPAVLSVFTHITIVMSKYLEPICSIELDWKAWNWPLQRKFPSPLTKATYNKLMFQENWFLALNSIWKKYWPRVRWQWCVSNIWLSSFPKQTKVFSWKLLWGAIPIGNQIALRGINGSEICSRCKAIVEDLRHLFGACLASKGAMF